MTRDLEGLKEWARGFKAALGERGVQITKDHLERIFEAIENTHEVQDAVTPLPIISPTTPTIPSWPTGPVWSGVKDKHNFSNSAEVPFSNSTTFYEPAPIQELTAEDSSD